MEYVAALAPSLGLGLLFYFVVRAFVTADRRERAVTARLREDVREKLRREAEQATNQADHVEEATQVEPKK